MKVDVSQSTRNGLLIKCQLALEGNFGLPTGTRTPIDRLGGDCSILLSYGETE
jgi:hypothetical protein